MSDENQKLNEPHADYMQLKSFTSMEEAEAENIRESLAMTPEQRLAFTTALIKKVYAEELSKHRGLGTRLYFDKR